MNRKTATNYFNITCKAFPKKFRFGLILATITTKTTTIILLLLKFNSSQFKTILFISFLDLFI